MLYVKRASVKKRVDPILRYLHTVGEALFFTNTDGVLA